MSLAIFISDTASVLSAPLREHERVVRGERGELVRRGHERQPGELGDLRRGALGELRVARSARCRPPCRRWRARRARAASPRSRSRSCVELGDVAAELLAERERHRVLQVRAADLHDVGELLRPWPRARRAAPARSGRARCTISSAAAMCIAVGNVSFDDCDMFTSSFGWTGFLMPMLAAGQLDGAVGDHLVDVHVRLRAAAGLPDAEREVVVELARRSPRRRPARSGRAFSAGELAELAVDQRRGLLQDRRCRGSPRRACGRRRWRSGAATAAVCAPQ